MTKCKGLRNVLNETETQVVAPDDGGVPAPGGCTQELREDAPGTTAKHPLAAVAFIPL